MNKPKRNINGLLQAAQNKQKLTRTRVEQAIKLLIKNNELISFKRVAETAQVSQPWLYQQVDIRDRIERLRQQQNKTVSIAKQTSRTHDASKDAIITTLKKRNSELEAQIKELRKQLEIAYGRLYVIENKLHLKV